MVYRGASNFNRFLLDRNPNNKSNRNSNSNHSRRISENPQSETRPHSSPAPPAGGTEAEAGRIHSPRQIVSPCLVRISSFNHLDFARNSFELCPTNTAKIRNSDFGSA